MDEILLISALNRDFFHLSKIAWNYYDGKKNTANSFSKEERESWNEQRKGKFSLPEETDK
jgi:hypothetical protein